MAMETSNNNSATERLEMLLNALPIGVVIIDRQTRKIIDLNPQASVYFDLPSDQLVGKTCTDHICPSQSGKCPILDQGQTLDRSEREIITKDGSRIPVLKTVIEALIDDRPVLIECIIDIRDKILAQQEHLKRERLQTALEMAGAICHGFNQPLQVILGHCELMRQDLYTPCDGPETLRQLTEKIEEYVDKIMLEVNKMSVFTRNLSNITKYETKPYLKSKIMDIERSSGKEGQSGTEPTRGSNQGFEPGHEPW
jgi:PAS domain S-box-containing protein